MFNRWMDVKLSWEQHTLAIRQVRNIKPIRFVHRMEFQIDQSNEERSPVASTIDPSPISKVMCSVALWDLAPKIFVISAMTHHFDV